MKNKKGNIYGRELFHKIEQQNLQNEATLANHVSDIKHVKIASKFCTFLCVSKQVLVILPVFVGLFMFDIFFRL